jgi:hypothetical protein
MNKIMNTEDYKLQNYNNYISAIACQDPNFTIANTDGSSSTPYNSLQDFVTNILNVTSDAYRINMIKYLQNSNTLTDLENINETSSKLEKMQHAKLGDLKSSLNSLHNSQYSSIQDFNDKTYKYNKFKFAIGVFIHTILISCMIFISASLNNLEYISQKTFIIFFSILSSIYVIYMLLNIRQNMNRRGNDWNKFYFDIKKTAKKI